MQKIENVYKKGQKPIPFYFVEDYYAVLPFSSPFNASTTASFNFEAT